jgi:hypothetical protein
MNYFQFAKVKQIYEVTHLQDRGVTDITDGLLNYFC